MRIAVFIKQVPDSLSVSMKSDNTIDRGNMDTTTNPADQSAVDMAVELKKDCGGEVVCVSMGPESAKACLRESAMAGADSLYLISDKRLAGADTLITASVLSSAVKAVGGADLIIMGRRSVDGDTGQVGPEIAAMLGWPCLNHVTRVSAEGKSVICDCARGNASEKYRCETPAVVCVCERAKKALMPSLAVMRRAAHIGIVTLNLDDMGLGEISGGDSPTKVSRVHVNARETRKVVWLNIEEAANVIMSEIGKPKGGVRNGR